MQRNQDVIAACPESTNPVLRVALAGVAYQLRAFGGSSDERAERLERELRDAAFYLQGDQPGPCDANVQAVIRLPTRRVGGVVSWPGREPHVPIFSGGDLWRVGFVAVDEPSEQLAGLRGAADRKQKMPHHRHPVTAQNKALDVAEIECALPATLRLRVVPGDIMLRAPEKMAEEALAFSRCRHLRLAVLSHSASPFTIRLRRIVACCRRSGHECPEPIVPDRLDRIRSECGLHSLRNQ